MVGFGKYKSFQWDKGNVNKNYQKHGTTPNQTEEVFLDEELKILKDFKHSQKELRFIALGKTFSGEKLFVVFTVREERIRVISARSMNE